MASQSVLPDNPTVTESKPRKPRTRPNPVVHKSTRKAPAIQTAILAKRMNGHSKRQIARETGVAVNTVTSILELNDVDAQIAKARTDAIALAPAAVAAIDRDLKFPGTGALGLRLLNDIGAIGEDALETVRRHSQRQAGAINVLVQSGATLHMGDTPSHHNVPLSDTATICSNKDNGENNSTDTVNDKVTVAKGTPQGKHPKAAPTHQ